MLRTVKAKLVLFSALLTLTIVSTSIAVWVMGKKVNTSSQETAEIINFGSSLKERVVDHKTWALKAANAIFQEKKELGVQTDPTKCKLGEFLASEELKAWKADNSEIATLFDQVEKPHQDLHQSAIAIEEHLYTDDRSGAIKIYQTDTIEALGSVESILFKAVDVVKNAAEGKMASQAKTAAAQNKVVGVTLAIGLVVIGFLVVVLMKSVLLPLSSLSDLLRDIAEKDGDLTVRLSENRKDEFGRLSSSFNTFVKKIQGSLNKVSDNTVGLKDSIGSLEMVAMELTGEAGEMSSKSSMVASAAEQISASVNIVTQATEHMSNNVNSIAGATEQMSSNVNAVATAIEEMSSSLQEVTMNTSRAAHIVQNATDRANETNKVMGHLNIAAEEIGKIVTVISDIADQTNLLALNATIEAASAGDAGKGFAVVANEVKELAKQTAKATEEIKGQIGQMQSKTKESIESIKSVHEIIEEINSITGVISAAVEEQSATINEIARSVSGAADGASEVTKRVSMLSASIEKEVVNGIKEAAKGVNDISRNIQNINASSQNTAVSANRTNQVSEQISDLSKQLHGIVSQFKL